MGSHAWAGAGDACTCACAAAPHSGGPARLRGRHSQVGEVLEGRDLRRQGVSQANVTKAAGREGGREEEIWLSMEVEQGQGVGQSRKQECDSGSGPAQVGQVGWPQGRQDEQNGWVQ